MNKQTTPLFLPIVFVFIILNGVIIIAKSFLVAHGFDTDVLIYANAFLFLITALGFLLQKRGAISPNPNVFVRSVYASMMVKMFACMIAALLYVFLMRSKVNKPGLFASLGMYIMYTVVEVSALMKVARKKNV